MATEAPPGAGLDLLTAVRWTLERDPNVALEEARLEAARGVLVVARGEFDPVIAASTTVSESRIPDSADSVTETRALESTLGLSFKLRSGLSLEPEVSLRRSEDLEASDLPGNEGTVTFRIRQPLLRGRGREVTTAREAAAERELAAAALDLEQRISDRLRAVVSQYWTWLAAEVDLEVLRASEAGSRELLEKTRLLIAADQVPAAELVQLEANLAAKESATIGGEQALFRARQDLGREIGLEAGEIAALSRPADTFPALDASTVPGLGQSAVWVDEARRRRADHRAAEARWEGAEILRRAAASDLQPVLDLIFAPTWSGFDTGEGAGRYFAPLGRNVPGAGASLGFSLLWPTGNHEAEGVLIQSEAALRQSALEVERVAKALGADVPAALDGLRRSAQRLEKANQAVRLFERAVVNEEKKLRAGTSTLLDLISQQDRLTAARQSEVAAELAVAQALVRLRFETGTLFADRGEAAEIQASRLITVPSVRRDEP
jgi:outer membrane protein TolC